MERAIKVVLWALLTVLGAQLLWSLWAMYRIAQVMGSMVVIGAVGV